MNQFIYFTVFLLLLALIIRSIFRQKELQFKLLKGVFPQKLTGVDSYYSLLRSFKLLKLPFSVQIWIYSPIYYHLKLDDYIDNEIIKSHGVRLRRSNKVLLTYLVIYIIWLFAGGKILL